MEKASDLVRTTWVVWRVSAVLGWLIIELAGLMDYHTVGDIPISNSFEIGTADDSKSKFSRVL